jgi:hypothetical protein
MRLIFLSSLCLIACNKDGTSGTITDTDTPTTAAGATTATGSTTSSTEPPSCTATIQIDNDDDGIIDRVRFEKWAAFPDQQINRVDHFGDETTAVTRRDWFDWDANGNNIEYARDDYNDGVLEIHAVTTYDVDDIELSVVNRGSEVGDRVTTFTNVNGRHERADVDVLMDGVINLYTTYTYDAEDRSLGSSTFDATDDSYLTSTMVQYSGGSDSMNRTLTIDLTGNGNGDSIRVETYGPYGTDPELSELSLDVDGDGDLESHTAWTRDATGWWTSSEDRNYLQDNLAWTKVSNRSVDSDGFLAELTTNTVFEANPVVITDYRETYTWDCNY